jgi:hypothetical protein
MRPTLSARANAEVESRTMMHRERDTYKILLT